MVELDRVCGIMKIDAFCHRSLLCVVLFLSAGVLAKDGLPDTTKATVIDGLSVLGVKNDIATPECHDPPTVGSQLLDIIAKTATVPLRAEKSETKDGKVKWRPVDPRME